MITIVIIQTWMRMTKYENTNPNMAAKNSMFTVKNAPPCTKKFLSMSMTINRKSGVNETSFHGPAQTVFANCCAYVIGRFKV